MRNCYKQTTIFINRNNHQKVVKMVFTTMPVGFTKESVESLQERVNNLYVDESVPLYLRLILDHDVLNSFHRVKNFLELDPEERYVFFQSDATDDLTEEYLRLQKLTNAVAEPYNTQRVNLADAVGNAIRQYMSSAYNMDKPIHLDIDSSVEAIGNPELISLMTYNILKNSSLYAPDSPALKVSVESHEGNPLVSVADGGSTPLSPDDAISQGKSGGKGKGNAMHFTEAIMNSYGGILAHDYTDRDAKRGTTFYMLFPNPNN